MNEQPTLDAPADGRSHITSPAQLARAVATSMAEIAGNISGTIAGVMAAPLTANSHAAEVNRGMPHDGDAASPREDEERLAATSRLETGEPPTAEGRDGQASAGSADGAAPDGRQ
jgi:hypothetical protein